MEWIRSFTDPTDSCGIVVPGIQGRVIDNSGQVSATWESGSIRRTPSTEK